MTTPHPLGGSRFPGPRHARPLAKPPSDLGRLETDRLEKPGAVYPKRELRRTGLTERFKETTTAVGQRLGKRKLVAGSLAIAAAVSVIAGAAYERATASSPRPRVSSLPPKLGDILTCKPDGEPVKSRYGEVISVLFTPKITKITAASVGNLAIRTGVSRDLTPVEADQEKLVASGLPNNVTTKLGAIAQPLLAIMSGGSTVVYAEVARLPVDPASLSQPELNAVFNQVVDDPGRGRNVISCGMSLSIER